MSNLFIISGPSGVGEDSVINGLENYFKIEKVVTTTTRVPRKGESEGSPYYFVDKKSFNKMIKEDNLAEYACEYNGNYYGVTYQELERARNTGKIVLWKIEYKGVITAKKRYPEVKSIYIAPPSLEILKERLLRRDPEIDETYLRERLSYTREWLKHEDIYDYKVVNEEGRLNETVKRVAEIIRDNLNS